MRCKLNSATTLIVCVMLTGCGYVGDPLPPALHIPSPIPDFNAVPRRNKVVVSLRMPELTTEGLPVQRLQGVDLRIGPVVDPWNQDAWAAGARPVPIDATGARIAASAPAEEWYGREIAVAVRLLNHRGRPSEWSNFEVIHAKRATPAPSDLTAGPDPEGVRLRWTGQSEGARYRVWRKAPKDPSSTVVATLDSPGFLDKDVALGSEYIYSLQTISNGVESELSPEVRVVPRDVFPPRVPSGVSAVASLTSIELGWERSPEPDVQGYRVYRAEGAGELRPISGTTTETAYGDRQIASGQSYRYAVTSVDVAGNESAKSSVVTVTAP
ncbi:MAG TPA: hypothetical protein VEQ63_02625, partial [Bryobacteraceae bacterium]|nr:hypothetical protein [Bryobacteraceae bacterium]